MLQRVSKIYLKSFKMQNLFKDFSSLFVSLFYWEIGKELIFVWKRKRARNVKHNMIRSNESTKDYNKTQTLWTYVFDIYPWGQTVHLYAFKQPVTTEDFLVGAHVYFFYFFFLCFLCARLQTWITLPVACFFNFSIHHQSWTDGEGLEEKKKKRCKVITR